MEVEVHRHGGWYLLLQTASATATGSSGSPPRIKNSFYVASGAAPVEGITLALLPLGSNNFTVAVPFSTGFREASSSGWASYADLSVRLIPSA